MDHLSCEVLQNLCLSISRSHDVIGQIVDKICVVDQFLDVMLASTAEAEVARGNRCSSISTGADVVCVGDVTIEGSKLYLDSVLYNTGAIETPGTTVPFNIAFTSEALYCKTLLDITPTDDRLLANPRRVTQHCEEIDTIERQNWQCLKTMSSESICACIRDHVMGMGKVLCDGLLGGSWQCILQEIVDISEHRDTRGTSHKEITERQRMFHLGVKLHIALTDIKSTWYPRTDSSLKHMPTEDTILHNVDQILSQLPECLSKTDTLDNNVGHKATLGVYVAKLCSFLNSVAVTTVTDDLNGTSTENLNEKEDRLYSLVRRVNERLQGYEDCLVKILSQHESLDEDEQWILCFENNCTALAIPSVCKQLCNVVMAMNDQQRNSPRFNRLLKVFLLSFAALPPLSQNQICCDIWCQPCGHSLFSNYNQEGFHQDMTTAFNRVVNVGTADGLEEIIGEISLIALQSPSETLYTAINRAVSNSAAMQSILKVLQLLPFLASFKQPGNGRPLLVEIIRDIIDTCNDMSNTEEANLIHVISKLIKPYKLEANCPYEEQPLLSCSQLMEYCILPYIHGGTMGNHGNQLRAGRLDLCVKILDVALKSFESAGHTSPSDAGWILEISPYPIILCLCDLLDQSYALWDMTSPSSLTPDMKEMVTGILSRICDMLQLKDKQEFDSGVQWLLKQVSDLHWTVQLQLGVCMQDWIPQYKKVVPACLFDICELSSEHWTVIQRTESDPSTLSDQLVTWLFCCRISNQMTAQFCQALKLKENQSRLDFFQATLVAMTTVFPQSSLGEMERIVCAVKHLIIEGILQVPVSSQFVTCLPMFSYTDHLVVLSMCQLFTSCVTLMASSCCEDWVSVPMWAHVIKGVVMCFKNITLDIACGAAEKLPSSAPGSIFALSQVFCRICHMITLIPHEIGEQLFVLALEVMGMIEDSLSRAANRGQEQCELLTNEVKDKFEWTNEELRAMQMVINELVDEDQRKTLMQKLCSLKENENRTAVTKTKENRITDTGTEEDKRTHDIGIEE